MDTPALVVDLDAFEANVALGFERWAGVEVRPHLKTAKSPDVARRLIAAGAVGICVGKLGEAEVMLDAGLDDVLVTTELVGPDKLARLNALRVRHLEARLRLVVDSIEQARALDAAVQEPIEVLVDVDVGQDRTGVQPAEARALGEGLRELTRLRVVGAQGYQGHLQHVRDPAERAQRTTQAMDVLAAAVEDLRAAGLRIDVVSTGGTGTAETCAQHPVVTEVQPGSFAFMDADYAATGGVPYGQALTVHATVLSVRPGRATVDAGLKALSDDSGPALVGFPSGWHYHHAGDEHGTLTPADPAVTPLQVGDPVVLVPSHCDTTINLFDEMHVARNGQVVERWPVAARGRVR